MKHHVRPLRLMEWQCAILILAMGLHLLVLPETFNRPSMAGLSQILSYQAWVTILICIGIARIIALWVNGRWPEGTPQIRAIGAAFGTAIFGAFGGGIYTATAGPGVGLGVTVFVILMGADILSSGFAASDFMRARRVLRQNGNVQSFTG